MNLASGKDPVKAEMRAKLEKEFRSMMSALYKEEGAELRIEILQEPGAMGFIQAHSDILDSSFETTEMSDTLRQNLQNSDWMFSGMKTFHELNEAFPSLLDDKGNRKPFEQFLNDVQRIDNTYNRNYLRAEYNFAQGAAEMAARWEQFEEDGDRYLLQYRTVNDGLVRPEHAALHGVTLPKDDSFWNTYYPPNGWNCRCTVVQVSRSTSRVTSHEEAMSRAGEALPDKKVRQMFGFNSGKERRTFPAYNPYTISKCATCDKAKLNLAAGIPANEVCRVCNYISSIGHKESAANEALFRSYPESYWEHTFISEDKTGFVVTERQRIVESEINKTEQEKFKTEVAMCKVIANNGHNVEYLHGVGRNNGETYDVTIDKTPADLKTISGQGSSMLKHARHAFRDQGAKMVVFELPNHSSIFYSHLSEIKRKYDGQILFYFKDEGVLKEIKK